MDYSKKRKVEIKCKGCRVRRVNAGIRSGSKQIKHQLEYSIWSAKVSWCPICLKHFYNEGNQIHTTKATSEHYHLFDCH